MEKDFLQPKNDMSKSLSHTQYPNHLTNEINTLFEPVFVKLDKQVSYTFHAYLKRSNHILDVNPLPYKKKFENRAVFKFKFLIVGK